MKQMRGTYPSVSIVASILPVGNVQTAMPLIQYKILLKNSETHYIPSLQAIINMCRPIRTICQNQGQRQKLFRPATKTATGIMPVLVQQVVYHPELWNTRDVSFCKCTKQHHHLVVTAEKRTRLHSYLLPLTQYTFTCTTCLEE